VGEYTEGQGISLCPLSSRTLFPAPPELHKAINSFVALRAVLSVPFNT